MMLTQIRRRKTRRLIRDYNKALCVCKSRRVCYEKMGCLKRKTYYCFGICLLNTQMDIGRQMSHSLESNMSLHLHMDWVCKDCCCLKIKCQQPQTTNLPSEGLGQRTRSACTLAVRPEYSLSGYDCEPREWTRQQRATTVFVS